MFSQNSRYARLPDAIIVDEHGRSLPSKTLRLLPDVSGQFLHTVEESNRLDHLAYKYYQQPKRWWRICDANPQFLSPQALLGKEPIVTERFPLEHDDALGPPPWSELLRTLSQAIGVMDVRVEERWELIPGFVESADGEQLPTSVDYFRRAVVVTYNTTIVTERFPLRYDDSLGPVPWAALVRALSEATGVIDIRVEEHVRRAVVVIYNTTATDATHLTDLIQGAGFAAGQPQREGLADLIEAVGFGRDEREQPQREGRAGKVIVIPPPA